MQKRLERMQLKARKLLKCGTQQECILSGGVYLRHRLRKANSQKHLPAAFLTEKLYHKNPRRARLAFGRSGVQETIPRFDLTRQHRLGSVESNTCFVFLNPPKAS